MSSKVDACIVSFNTKDLTLKSLTSLRSSLRDSANLMVWDNASKDGSKVALAEYAERNPVQVFLSPTNLGYGTALNRAFAAGKAPYLLCLNSDMEYPNSGWLETLVQFLESDEKKGVVGPLLINQKGECGGAGVVGTDKNPVIRFWGKPIPQVEQHLRQPKQVLSVCGACMLIRRSVFEKVGGFDERLFFYYDETDLNRRVRSYGHQVWFTPSARVMHMWNKSPNPYDKTKSQCFVDAKAVYAASWGDELVVSET